MRRYASDISGPRRLEEDDAGYVADSSSSSSEYGDGEERPLLRRETEWWASAAPSANASVETVVAVGKVKEGRVAEVVLFGVSIDGSVSIFTTAEGGGRRLDRHIM
ncbi:uncharacterized protein LAJ45_03783 [Morchella importuna]|uniref:uncharacterized protein n=1 Tax=Morchella importuna TaxID=1174673 RepID=UPI001E8EC690|nr:uncharacterized protein LAJ45_03783 [Morchella importuna]KAH8152356.1 hypothetical protein LAJ45_03783 [Morchella importuna]